MARVGLLRNGEMAQRQSLELYLLNPVQMITWVAKRAGLGYFRAVTTLSRISALCTMQERRMTSKMQRIFRKIGDPRLLINAAPEKLPCRNEGGIRSLFQRLEIPIKQFRAFGSCYIVLRGYVFDDSTPNPLGLGEHNGLPPIISRYGEGSTCTAC
jgi:hypothetical protein